MNNDFFYFSQPSVSFSVCDSYPGTPYEKDLLLDMIKEWNTRTCISDLSNKWKKERPTTTQNLNLEIILFNVECLNTHITDVGILLTEHKPHVCILTGVGTATKNLPTFPGYKGISQKGTNSFGGVAILFQNFLQYKIIEKDSNFILVELETSNETVIIGAIYVPPGSLPPFQLFNQCKKRPFYIFRDFNAKHTTWGSNKNNTSGIHIFDWLEATGNDLIVPQKATSKRSNSIIDFGLTHDATGWNSEVLEEATSDHWPVLFQSPIIIVDTFLFKQTKWSIFTFFLSAVFQYWNSLVYNLDTETFFTLFSSFLNALQDRCSTYVPSNKYRPPWPPTLVLLARTVNKYKRAYRRSRTMFNLNRFKIWKEIFSNERAIYMQSRWEKKITWINEGNNIWKSVKPTFRPFTPPFKGITTKDGKLTNQKEIVNILANYYEKHFSAPKHDPLNESHQQSINIFNALSYTPAIPLQQITLEEVTKEWKKFLPKKSSDSTGTSAFILKKLPVEYLQIITVLFNKCALNGSFFESGKIAKTICLSKDGLYPTENKLRPISLLPNIAKWFERIIHNRILTWCHIQNIATDEQSGFMKNRRLQTRILGIIENLRLTVAACNRPALTIFVDFLSAFDRMWYPALIRNLYSLEMPLPLLKWIHTWLQNRYLYISFGDANSRIIKMDVGAPQGSVLAATLFRLHVHFLPSYFFDLAVHMFADDLAIVIPGSLENKFSLNISEIQERAKIVMKQLEKFSNELILPVNVNKTKALLVHNVVSPPHPTIVYGDQMIEYVKIFRYLGVYISTKLGWGQFISERLKKIRNIYNALNIIFRSIPLSSTTLRRKIFLAYALPHFCWLFCTWFHYTDNQRKLIEHVYCTGIRIVYALKGWDDITTLILTREKNLLDYLYGYWYRLSKHLESAPDALSFQQSWKAYEIIKSPDTSWIKSMGFRRNSIFPKRLIERARHTLEDWRAFEPIQKENFECYKKSTTYLNIFVYKYFLEPP